MKDPRIGERRFDQYGEFRLMARAEGYVLVRRKGAVARCMTQKEWDKLSETPDLKPPEPKLKLVKQ